MGVSLMVVSNNGNRPYLECLQTQRIFERRPLKPELLIVSRALYTDRPLPSARL
jgi:hypothetical protein